MDVKAPRGLMRILGRIEDPRIDRAKMHSLFDILVVTLCAVICGADAWTEVELFGKSKLAWLRTFLALPHGIPSHDTFGRVFSRIRPDQLEQCFMEIVNELARATGGGLLAVDGKTVRNSFDKVGNKAAVHMVSAWSETNRLVLGHAATEQKSNEITAIPKLLALLDLTDTVVTIEARGCQKKIAGQIVHQEVHVGHGRIERRCIWTTEWTSWYGNRGDWAGLQTFVCVERERIMGDRSSLQRSYYISDLKGVKPERILRYVRGHWGVENKHHWCLDVGFSADGQRQRIGYSA